MSGPDVDGGDDCCGVCPVGSSLRSRAGVISHAVRNSCGVSSPTSKHNAHVVHQSCFCNQDSIITHPHSHACMHVCMYTHVHVWSINVLCEKYDPIHVIVHWTSGQSVGIPRHPPLLEF